MPVWVQMSSAGVQVLTWFPSHSRFNWSSLVPLQLRGRTLGLQAEDSEFRLEGMPFRIFGGSMHYFRVPKEYWRDRMVKMKTCGLNTLTTYVPWNLHEAANGKFDFSGNLDLEAFLTLAAEVGLWVILRPGPYICSEWDLGGLPSWLLQDPEMQLRTTYKGFTEAVDAYFDHLMTRVVPLQYKKGGPIIAVQVENEYGSYAKDPQYLTYIKMALLDRGIVELLMTSDNRDGLSSGYVEGVNMSSNQERGITRASSDQNKPKMVMEYWTGWFDSWGGPHNIFDADEVLKTGASINLYMFHGGTNFGFMNGALDSDEYKPDVTSYDYDAVLTEAGDYTSKFFKLRQLFTKIIGGDKPQSPFSEYLSKCWFSEFPVNMENLPVNDGNGQAYGYTLYETVISGGGQLHSRDHVRDRAQVKSTEQLLQLRLLVENCGRVNYGLMLNEQRKGLIGDVFLNKTPLRNFKIYSLEMKPGFMESLRGVTAWSTIPDYAVGPAFFRGNLQVQYLPRDTFLKLEGWEKGVVFVNGENLGRYWKIGPQETLYLPATWLHPGNNEIIVFEERMAGRIIQSVDMPYLGRTHYLD
uniref:Beta-galactosidase n=1 Tax=Chelonoidis abingdonii TaxID=106734 RepID=A0A8C0IMY9_CHEAB